MPNFDDFDLDLRENGDDSVMQTGVSITSCYPAN